MTKEQATVLLYHALMHCEGIDALTSIGIYPCDLQEKMEKARLVPDAPTSDLLVGQACEHILEEIDYERRAVDA